MFPKCILSSFSYIASNVHLSSCCLVSMSLKKDTKTKTLSVTPEYNKGGWGPENLDFICVKGKLQIYLLVYKVWGKFWCFFTMEKFHRSHTFQEASHTSLWYISSQIMLTFLVKFMHHKSHKNPLPSSLPSVMKEFLGNSSRSWRTSFKNFVYPWTLTHTSVCMFSILLSVLFLRGWQGEFLYQSRASLVVDYFLYSCDLNAWLRGGMVRRN